MLNFEEIEHTADRAFRVTGSDLADLLKNAAHAMHSLDGPRPAGGKSATREIEVEGVDPESLLVNWLNEILYLEQAHQLVCEEFHIEEFKNHHLRARVEARECDQSYTRIKAVTFHNLKIRQTSEGLEAELVLDV
jgi:SHS2 domain-containing protein